MVTKLLCNYSNPPIGGLVLADLVKNTNPISIEWGKETSICFTNTSLSCVSNNDVLRAIIRNAPKYQMYGTSPIERTTIDHWLTLSLSCAAEAVATLKYMNRCLGPRTYLVANRLTIADLALFHEVFSNLQKLHKIGIPTHVQRWYDLINANPSVKFVLNNLPEQARNLEKVKTDDKTNERKEEGKFVELPGAEMGKVVVRFPPEASGYLHIGHAKAALLNQYYQQAFEGKLIMRFDDTNPAKENVHFEQVILEDLEMLEIKPDMFTHTSQYFDIMLEYCETLMKDQKAYVDNTPPEQMKLERDQKMESANRSNSVDKNFQMWQEMLKGSAEGQKCCVRAKIDMESLNGCLRDPTIYRCKNEPHPRTGTKYKVYPTYDFACPIVDAIENVTHTLRTMEYHDRDDQFYWFIDALKLRKPYIWEYSRLNMTNTVLSKRKLTWFVEQGYVDGWDDPRFPTVRGILRRGMTVEGLKQFIIAQGSSKSVVFMEWDKIWAFNRKVIDPIAPRYTALEYENRIIVNVAGAKLEALSVPVHPKNSEIGEKTVWVGPQIMIDYVDAETLKENENATFINWGNIKINKINKDKNRITSIDATLNLENKDFKKTVKLTWLCKQDDFEFPPTHCCYFEHLISKPVLAKDEDFKKYIGSDTWTTVKMLGDPALKSVKKGDIIQLQRRGFFKVDNAYEQPSEFSSAQSPIILLHIPDGHTKDMPTAGPPKKEKVSAKSAKQENAANKTESAPARSVAVVNDEIVSQGELVRNIKAQKAPKPEIDGAVKKLLELKAEYKSISGTDWKPGTTVPVAGASSNTATEAKIIAQGEKVRLLKSQKASKPEIEKEVKLLLEYKTEYKAATGQDWKPPVAAAAAPAAITKPIDTTTTSKSSATEINQKITEQGDIIRNLKSAKAGKPEIEEQVKKLLALKADYKQATGQDWKPGAVPPVSQATNETSDAQTISNQIVAQGDRIRDLKTNKAEKSVVEPEVKKLLALKTDYKQATGQDWKPGVVPKVSPTTKETSNASDALAISNQIVAQGDRIRDLKTNKAEKSIVEPEVKKLLVLKAEYKSISGTDWKPPAAGAVIVSNTLREVNASVETKMGDPAKDILVEKINNQGNAVRNLKTSGGSKADIDAAVKLLLDLKVEYKTLTGTDFPVAGRTPAKPKSAEGAKKENKPIPKDEKKSKEDRKAKEDKKTKTEIVKDTGVKKQTRLGLEATKEDNLPDWYSQVITKGEMIEYYDVSGCYILRHWSFAIWKVIKNWFDAEITKMGVKECYFPIFVSKAALEKEKTHIADFAPEVAWVTKSGESDLAEPIAVRPTSETVMYPAYAKWIQSYRDLPIRLNQWNNVVRWEFKHPQPFLRTREFLWQEGHTAFATQKEATDEVYQILDLYAQVYTDLLAIPVIKGRKTEKEKFAGGDFTTTVEAFVSASGRGIQGATSHHLGQNFSKMFEIVFEDPETQQKQFVYQNSWGITTRTIGVMIMIHADNQGLVLPPNVACIQVIIVPCGLTANTTDAERNDLLKKCGELESKLKTKDIRVEGDYRDNYSPGWKYNHWELKGVPIRIELGPKDVKANQFVAVRRDTGEKIIVKNDGSEVQILNLLKTIHESMLRKATLDLESHTKITKNWDEFCKYLDSKNIIMSPFCGDSHCEEQIKADSARDEANAEPGAPAMGAKTLCIPFEQPKNIDASDKCIRSVCTNKPKFYTLFGRSY